MKVKVFLKPRELLRQKLIQNSFPASPTVGIFAKIQIISKVCLNMTKTGGENPIILSPFLRVIILKPAQILHRDPPCWVALRYGLRLPEKAPTRWPNVVHTWVPARDREPTIKGSKGSRIGNHLGHIVYPPTPPLQGERAKGVSEVRFHLSIFPWSSFIFFSESEVRQFFWRKIAFFGP